jgi:uncharacterized protein (UPF0335 family)
VKLKPTYAELERSVESLEKENQKLRHTVNELRGEDKAQDFESMNAALHILLKKRAVDKKALEEKC